MTVADFKRQFESILLAGSNVIWINLSADEGRCERALYGICEGEQDEDNNVTTPGLGYAVHKWSMPSGASWDQELMDPTAFLQSLPQANLPGSSVIIAQDLHLLLNAQNNFPLRRALSELCKNNALNTPEYTRALVILADTPTPHPDIKDYCDIIDFPLPSFAEMQQLVTWVEQSVQASNEEVRECDTCPPELRDRLAEAMLGLTEPDAERTLASGARTHGFTEELFPIIGREKANLIRKIEGLTYVPHSQVRDEDTLAGFDNLKDFVHRRKRAYTQHAQREGIPRPRGLVLIGPPGSGKTVTAKCVAKMLGLDLIMMDIGSMYDSLVGASEKRIRMALSTVGAMRNSVLMVDEIDKAFAGAHKNAATDSGVSSRILSYFLTWLSERDMSDQEGNRTFVMVTMNRTAGVPPELLRPGRFDRIFYTDLPDADERPEHLRIQLERNGIDPEFYGKSLKAVVSATDEFSGAELEEVVVAARHTAYDRVMTAWEAGGSDGDPPSGEALWPTVDDLVKVVDEITPAARLNKEEITELREFCRQRAVPVTGHRAKGTGRTRQARNVKRSADPQAN